MHLDRQQRQGQDAQDFFNLANIFLKTSGLRDGTRKFYGGYLQVFLDRISCNIRDITIEHLEAISLQVHKIKKTPAAYNNFVVVVKSFFSWLAKNGYCSNIGTVLQVIPHSKTAAKDNQRRIRHRCTCPVIPKAKGLLCLLVPHRPSSIRVRGPHQGEYTGRLYSFYKKRRRPRHRTDQQDRPRDYYPRPRSFVYQRKNHLLVKLAL